MFRKIFLGKSSKITKIISAYNAAFDWQTQMVIPARIKAGKDSNRMYHFPNELANPVISNANVIKELPIVFVLIQISDNEFDGFQILCPSGTGISVNTR
ncbi:hypothetical protein EMQU_3113 (plasmid) [Enterococcus mundtii QU 25]|nr:hypothetical protein EMQU_3113 [Enterococcus mundtii QU 25]